MAKSKKTRKKTAKSKVTAKCLKYKQLTAELIHRKMSFSNKEPFVMPQGKFEPNDWMPTEHDHEISRERLLEKIQQKPNFYRWTSRPKPNWVAAK